MALYADSTFRLDKGPTWRIGGPEPAAYLSQLADQPGRKKLTPLWQRITSYEGVDGKNNQMASRYQMSSFTSQLTS